MLIMERARRFIPTRRLTSEARWDRRVYPAWTDSCFLPAGWWGSFLELEKRLAGLPIGERKRLDVPLSEIRLLVPIPAPSKLLLLAGNYSKHIEEGGGRAEERVRTFPYVFMKPPLTTLTHPDAPVKIPAVSPHHIDWELELGVIMGKRCKGVPESESLEYVAGYTVVNDISDRKFRPNPGRAVREKDAYFDWLHGKWHDTFCPIGPCVLPTDDLSNPQELRMHLRVNGEMEQNASTAEMVFPVAAIIEFISSFVTLEPGDIISTGTPSGVGSRRKIWQAPVEAEIERIGVLRNPVE
jgi:2-keto-4-pentenoate hydratase/2-oxohepta-3-ene-1,7-dioic acid hydratase in catechol pathway